MVTQNFPNSYKYFKFNVYLTSASVCFSFDNTKTNFVFFFQRLTQSNESAVRSELGLMRNILERLECSFARQEAKLDRLLNIMATTQQSLLQTPQCLPQTSVQSTPFNVHAPSSLEYPPPPVVPRSREMERFDLPPPRTSFQEVDRLLDNTNAIGKLISLFANSF